MCLANVTAVAFPEHLREQNEKRRTFQDNFEAVYLYRLAAMCFDFIEFCMLLNQLFECSPVVDLMLYRPSFSISFSQSVDNFQCFNIFFFAYFFNTFCQTRKGNMSSISLLRQCVYSLHILPFFCTNTHKYLICAPNFVLISAAFF